MSEPISKTSMREIVTMNVLCATKFLDKLAILKAISLPSMRENVTTNVLNVKKLSEYLEI